MKRHNSKSFAATLAIAAAAAAEAKKKAEQNTSALYVDVVKNMPKSESPPTVTPPPPKFSILHEDFPALPGTAKEFRGGRIDSTVPDDWTTIISDDDDDDVLESATSDSISERSKEVVVILMDLANVLSDEDNPNSKDQEATPLAVDNNNNSSPNIENIDIYDQPKYGIFDEQFLMAGVAKRLWTRQNSKESSPPKIAPPPGFEHVQFYGRLRTNRMGVPLGGVTFDMTPAPYSEHWHQPNQSINDAYGLTGLANNLKAAQQNPRLLSQIFGHDTACLNVDVCSCACMPNKLHASFAGPLEGGRCAPHEINYNVPLHYRRSGRQDLPQPKIEQMQEELLFLFFHTYPGDMMQMLAAAELADRGWRYHIYERLWLRPQPDNPDYVEHDSLESGEYNYFNMLHWKIMPRHFELHPEQLERTITKSELREQYGYHPQMSF